MTDRMTKLRLEVRCENLNRRMAARGSVWRYSIDYRCGYTAIDRVYAEGPDAGAVRDTVRAGMTKPEAAEFVHAMMVALDDASAAVDDRCRDG